MENKTIYVQNEIELGLNKNIESVVVRYIDYKNMPDGLIVNLALSRKSVTFQPKGLDDLNSFYNRDDVNNTGDDVVLPVCFTAVTETILKVKVGYDSDTSYVEYGGTAPEVTVAEGERILTLTWGNMRLYFDKKMLLIQLWMTRDVFVLGKIIMKDQYITDITALRFVA